MELTDNEKVILEIFTSDVGAYQIVYKIAKDKIEKVRDAFIRSLPSKKDKTNEEIGAQIRAFDEGMLMVDNIFRELGTYKKITPANNINRAR